MNTLYNIEKGREDNIMKENKSGKVKRKKEKSIVKPIVMMTVSLILIFLINNFIMLIHNYLDSTLEKMIARTVKIELSEKEYEAVGDEIVSYLEEGNEEHIIDYAEGHVQGAGLEAYSEKAMEQYMITQGINELKDNEIIICKYITDSSTYTNNGAKEYQDGEELIGETITINVDKESFNPDTGEEKTLDSREYTFKVVGVYNNAKTDSYASGLISKDMMKEMTDFTATVYYDKKVGEYKKYYYNEINVIVDKAENVDSVAANLELVCQEFVKNEGIIKYGSIVSTSNTIEFTDAMKIIYGIQFFVNFIAAFIIVCAGINIYLYIRQCTDRRKREFGIMKAIGYRTMSISRLLLRETLLEIIIPLSVTYIFGIIVTFIINGYIKANFNVFVQEMIHFSISGSVSAVIISIGVVIPLLGYGAGVIKISKIEPMEALR